MTLMQFACSIITNEYTDDFPSETCIILKLVQVFLNLLSNKYMTLVESNRRHVATGGRPYDSLVREITFVGSSYDSCMTYCV